MRACAAFARARGIDSFGLRVRSRHRHSFRELGAPLFSRRVLAWRLPFFGAATLAAVPFSRFVRGWDRCSSFGKGLRTHSFIVAAALVARATATAEGAITRRMAVRFPKACLADCQGLPRLSVEGLCLEWIREEIEEKQK